jgi:hypothetical protein
MAGRETLYAPTALSLGVGTGGRVLFQWGTGRPYGAGLPAANPEFAHIEPSFAPEELGCDPNRFPSHSSRCLVASRAFGPCPRERCSVADETPVSARRLSLAAQRGVPKTCLRCDAKMRVLSMAKISYRAPHQEGSRRVGKGELKRVALYLGVSTSGGQTTANQRSLPRFSFPPTF